MDGLSLIRVRSFDAATFVGVRWCRTSAWSVMTFFLEFDYDDLYLPLDLGIGRCRLRWPEPRPSRRATIRGAGATSASRPVPSDDPAALCGAKACRLNA